MNVEEMNYGISVAGDDLWHCVAIALIRNQI
jgi:hypothetical protein